MNDPILLAAPPAAESLAIAGNVQLLQQKLVGIQKSFRTFSAISIILYPGIQSSTVKAMLKGTTPKVKGVVLQAFGAGNAPADDAMIKAFKEAHDNDGVVFCDITQIVSGGVDLDAYESAAGLRHAGAISGHDLTPEAALAKRVYLIGHGYTQKEVEEQMKTRHMSDLSRHVQEQTESHWKALFKKRGKGLRVCRLLLAKKRKASQMCCW